MSCDKIGCRVYCGRRRYKTLLAAIRPGWSRPFGHLIVAISAGFVAYSGHSLCSLILLERLILSTTNEAVTWKSSTYECNVERMFNTKSLKRRNEGKECYLICRRWNVVSFEFFSLNKIKTYKQVSNKTLK